MNIFRVILLLFWIIQPLSIIRFLNEGKTSFAIFSLLFFVSVLFIFYKKRINPLQWVMKEKSQNNYVNNPKKNFKEKKMSSEKRDKGSSLMALPDDYVVVDLETTGYDLRYDKIIEVGALKVQGGEIVSKFSSLINPKKPLTSFIVDLTGITDKELSSAPTFDEVAGDVLSFIGDEIVLGHNVTFDVNFLYDNFYEKDRTKFKNDHVDLYRLSKKVFTGLPNYKLTTVAEHCGIKREDRHRALDDCIVTHQAYKEMKNYIKSNDIDFQSLWKSKNKGSYYRAFDVSSLVSTVKPEDINPDTIFFKQEFVFTGAMEKYSRKDAAQIVLNLGGTVGKNVTKRTNYLVIGNLDFIPSIKDGKSTKQKKAEAMQLKGYDIKTISEFTFYEMLEDSGFKVS